MQKLPFARTSIAVALACLLAGCATERPYAVADATLHKKFDAQNVDAGVGTGQDAAGERLRTYQGTGVLVRGQQPGGNLPPSTITTTSGGTIVLNFEGADVREVVRNVLGDILNESYTIDPNVGGTITVRTSSGIPRESLPATLETVLRMAGATMVKEGNLYKIVPMANAVRGNLAPQLGNSQRALPQGYSVQIIPLRYISAVEMAKILEPFAKDAQAVRVDTVRNLLILAGTERELRHLIDTVDTFDINWMAGMSVGVFTLQNAAVKDVMSDLDKAIGDKTGGPLASIFKIIPIERMNAVMVVSPNAQYVEEAKKWIERLDRAGAGGDAPRFYVYNLQNTRAEHVGPLLQQAFTGRTTSTSGAGGPSVSPGTPAGSIVSPPSFSTSSTTATPTPAVTVNNQASAGGVAGTGVGAVRNLQVVADKDNNAILIVATPAEYQVIEQAMRKLDVASRQVVMEMAIIEVSLTDDFQFGIDWVFKGGAPGGRGYGGNVANPSAAATGGVATIGNVISGALSTGFSYLIGDRNGGIQAAIRLLDTYGNVKVVSNPHIAALDNQKATIKVGDRIPINQQSLVGGVSNVVTTTSSYIDTGVLVQVTPHINAGGLVTLDVQAEVSNPGTAAVAGDAPPISTRSVQTMVSVPSGDTMVMGGLITETKSNTTSGLPLVNRIPIIGGLFGNQDLKNNRTELVLFVTPRVVDNTSDVNTVINDLRRRMDNIDDLFPGGKNSGRIFPAGETTAVPGVVVTPKSAAPALAPTAPNLLSPSPAPVSKSEAIPPPVSVPGDAAVSNIHAAPDMPAVVAAPLPVPAPALRPAPQ